MSKKKILSVTGIRSEYDILYSVYNAIENHPNLDLKVIATGAHLSPLHSRSVNEIRNDGFEVVEEIESLINSDSLESRAKGLAIQMQGMIQTTRRINPDILLVLGDREESIATALIGSYMNIPVAHISGGDRVIGNVDDQIRHAVSKLSHIHFVTNDESYDRLIKMGEQDFRVYNTGNPGLDRIVDTENMSLEAISESLSIDLIEKPFIILIQHVISSETDMSSMQMEETMIAIERMGITTIMSHPNSDPGSNQIIRVIDKYKNLENLHILKNIPRTEFINLLRRASCLIGNSSAGILEAPILKLPVVNIGNRQKGRLHAENVEFVSHDSEKIEAAIKKALYDKGYRSMVENCSNPYGDGNSSKKIAEILNSLTIDDKLLTKDITY